MKNYIYNILRPIWVIFLSSFLFASGSLCAQHLSFSDTMITYKDNSVPAIHTEIRASADELRDAWESYLGEKFDVKVKGNGWLSSKKILRAEDASIIEIAPEEIDLMARFIPETTADQEQNIHMEVFAFMKYDVPVGPMGYPLQYEALKGISKNFLQDFITKNYRQKLELLKENLSEVREKKAEMLENIEEMKTDIDENQAEIASLRKENSMMYEEIDSKESEMLQVKQEIFEYQQKVEWYEKSISTSYAGSENIGVEKVEKNTSNRD